MAKKTKGPNDDVAKQVLEQMVAKRGERVHMGEHWDAARKAIGQARWDCKIRDVSSDIAEMRRELALSGKDLVDIGTTEAEITALLNCKKSNRNPAKAAQTYAKTVPEALKEGNLRSARMALTQLERKLDEAGLDMKAVGVTQMQYETWCARLRPPKKQKNTKTKS